MTREELAKLQKTLGLSAVKLADELGIEYSTFYRYLNGKLKIPRSIELALQAIEGNLAKDQKSDSSETIALFIKSPVRLSTNLKTFGEKVKNLRESKGIAQKDFADDFVKIGISYLSDIENGKKANISLRSIQKIAKRLKIKVEITFDYRE